MIVFERKSQIDERKKLKTINQVLQLTILNAFLFTDDPSGEGGNKTQDCVKCFSKRKG